MVMLGVRVQSDTSATLSCTEPTTNTDGSALTDLSKTTYYYRIPPSTTWVPCTEEAATVAVGGGNVSHVCAPSESVNGVVEFMARAVDMLGNESTDSSVVSKVIDNTVPSPPSCS